jgi:hypothetical protein
MVNFDQSLRQEPAFRAIEPSSLFQAGRRAFKMKLGIQLQRMKETQDSIFDEQYRVVAVEHTRLLIRGILSGEVFTIVNPEPEIPFTQEDYPPGKLIALTDPSVAPAS